MANQPPTLRQSSSNSMCRGEGRNLTATFSAPTIAKNLIVVTAVLGGGSVCTLTAPAGFVLIRDKTVGRLQVAMWYYEGAPITNSVTINASNDRSMQIRIKEYSGAAQTLALDKVAVLTNISDRCDSGYTGITAQADEVVVAAVANRHASCTQSGFSGGLTRLFESVSPQYYGRYGSNVDDDRTRLTFHHLIANAIGSYRLYCYLSSYRDWIAIIATFRGGSSGPKRMTSTLADPVLRQSGSGTLTAFGPLKSTVAPAMLSTAGGSGQILPFVFQFKFNGLLLGINSRYDVVSHDGLYGYNMRTSDDDQPRGDGAQRGVDLQSSRQVLFQIEVGGVENEVEQLIGVLYKTLRPQRDTDWELIWRHPAMGARLIRCRPIELPREVNDTRTKLAPLPVQLRAADPRHYSAILKSVVVPVTPAGSEPVTITVTNEGDIPAYPVITIMGPSSGPPVNRVELVNNTGLVSFDVQLTLPFRTVLVGDMDARVTGAPRSSVTLDGVPKYGSWQLPRTPFRIDPAPDAPDGENVLFVRTDPPGAPIVCTLDYRDSWAG